jgi:hypothetical protein
MRVKIYLRAIRQGDATRLALFDSKRQGGINDLTTDVYMGDTVIWKPDCCSGIKSITSISPKKADTHPVFLSAPRKRLFCTGFTLPIAKDAKEELVERYTIECILCDNSALIVDPYIRVLPPPG